jgi:hypothetical protein
MGGSMVAAGARASRPRALCTAWPALRGEAAICEPFCLEVHIPRFFPGLCLLRLGQPGAATPLFQELLGYEAAEYADLYQAGMQWGKGHCGRRVVMTEVVLLCVAPVERQLTSTCA